MSATLELPITGMTCASCANRVERRLNELAGVTATVNYATEKARVDFDAGAVAPEDLVGAVEAAGYSTRLPQADAPTAAEERVCVPLALGGPSLRSMLPRQAPDSRPSSSTWFLKSLRSRRTRRLRLHDLPPAAPRS